jgi:uncharacterized protein
VAEWLGRGLQSLVHQFESGRRLFLPGPKEIVTHHVEAFNAHDLDGLLACFASDATWVTGTDRFQGKGELSRLFGEAFAALDPALAIESILADGDRVACELREEFVVGDASRVERIAGFYRVEAGLITDAKIYREGSARA